MKSAFPLYLVKIFENTYNILWTFGGVFAIIVYRRACDKSALYGIVGFFLCIGRSWTQTGVNKMKKEEVFWDNESNKKGWKSC